MTVFSTLSVTYLDSAFIQSALDLEEEKKRRREEKKGREEKVV